MQAYFITGTDSNIGKTYVANHLLHHWREQNLRTIAFKPVASGMVQQKQHWVNEDAVILQHAATEFLPYDEVNPYCYKPAIAPHLAAQQAQRPIDLNFLNSHFKPYLVRTDIDRIILEGAGGLMVPLNDRQTWIDFLQICRIPVLVVCGMRLGVLNHAQLTVQALLQNNIPCAGWIANFLDPEFAYAEENFQTLQALLPVPCFSRVEYSENNGGLGVC